MLFILGPTLEITEKVGQTAKEQASIVSKRFSLVNDTVDSAYHSYFKKKSFSNIFLEEKDTSIDHFIGNNNSFVFLMPLKHERAVHSIQWMSKTVKTIRIVYAIIAHSKHCRQNHSKPWIWYETSFQRQNPVSLPPSKITLQRYQRMICSKKH